MKLINILTTLVVSGGLASVQAQHHLPATSNANINGGINSPTTSGNVDIKGVAVITDKADDTTRKLHDILTSVKGIMEEEFGLATAVGDGSGRRLSKSHKSDKGIGMIEEVLQALILVIVLLLAEFLWLGGGYGKLDGLLGAGEEEDDIADEITAAHHGHDGSSSKTAKSGGTDGSAKASKESKSSKSGGACPLGELEPGSVDGGDPCCASEDCSGGLCINEGSAFCIDPGASDLGVDCSTPFPCASTDECNIGTGEQCFIVPIEQCSPATAPATGFCFIN